MKIKYDETKNNIKEEEKVEKPKKKKASKEKVDKEIEQAKEDLLDNIEKEFDEELNDLDEDIKKWKQQYGKIYLNRIVDRIYVWKPINRSEYRQLLAEDSQEENNKLYFQEKLVKSCVLFPKNIDELIQEYAGLASALGDEILAYSGFLISETVQI